jgi:hypothetical protein
VLSTLPKLVDKNFVIGFIVPVLIGVLSVVVLLRDVAPFSSLYLSMLEADSFTKLTILIMALWTLAILLMLMNHQLYQLLEGYKGPFARVASWQRKMLAKYDLEARTLQDKYHDPATRPNEYYEAIRRFEARWPRDSRFVLPTRFGNVIRAAESYPSKVYGVDSIAVWLRLGAVISHEYQLNIEDARSQVDFFINSWFLLVLFSIIAIVRGIFDVYSHWHTPTDLITVIQESFTAWKYVVAGAGALLLAWAAYEGAIERAKGWGELVKSAFDLYLPALAKQLGYEIPPNEKRRRQFWYAASDMFLHQQPLQPECWLTAKPADNADGRVPKSSLINAERESNGEDNNGGKSDSAKRMRIETDP